jgi:hypothetical protein
LAESTFAVLERLLPCTLENKRTWIQEERVRDKRGNTMTDLTNKEQKILDKLTGSTPAKKGEPLIDWTNSLFGKDWYLTSWFDKILFVLGAVAMLWTIFKLAFFHTF